MHHAYQPWGPGPEVEPPKCQALKTSRAYTQESQKVVGNQDPAVNGVVHRPSHSKCQYRSRSLKGSRCSSNPDKAAPAFVTAHACFSTSHPIKTTTAGLACPGTSITHAHPSSSHGNLSVQGNLSPAQCTLRKVWPALTQLQPPHQISLSPGWPRIPYEKPQLVPILAPAILPRWPCPSSVHPMKNLACAHSRCNVHQGSPGSFQHTLRKLLQPAPTLATSIPQR